MEIILKLVAATTVIITCLLMNTGTTQANSDDVAPQPPPIAKPGCLPRCGEVDVPFPFGIGPGCSSDGKWFEIVCDNTTTTTTTNSNSTIRSSKPYLKSIPEVEVLNISTENCTLQAAKSPIWFFNCPDKKDGPSITAFNLSGSPFSFSESRNRFTAVGCNDFGYIDLELDNVTERAAGCTAVCPIKSSTADSSRSTSTSTTRVINNSTSYCQTIIPSYLSSYNIAFEDTNVSRCRYAFVVDQEWFGSRSRSDLFEGFIHKMGYVPVVLNWDLLQHDENLANHSNSRQCLPVEATCSIDKQRYQCFCRDGYKGNPYIHKGCQDINECEGNKTLCLEDYSTCVNTPGSYSCELKTERKIRPVLIGFSSGLGALILIFGAWGLSKLVKRRKDIKRKEKFFKRNGGLLLQQQLCSTEANVDQKTKLFNSKELEKATNCYNANRILGQGGQGTVYKGMLEDGKIVAVKKSKLDNKGQVAEFINEVVILSQINHRNVVKLLGCCLETKVPLLVYEFIPNGTLYHYIHDQSEEFQLTWEIRLRIATEVAGALSYLHYAASIPIYHRDIKSTNILLDGKYRAKIADFGTSRSISEDQTHLTTRVSGTFGYLDPEYFRSSQYTEKSDVYSFGVVIIELLSGQKPVSPTCSRKGSRSLATYFVECMDENRLFDIIDPRIMNEAFTESIRAVANLAYRCLNLVGKNRPTMKEVATELEGLRESLKVLSSDHDHRDHDHNQIFEKTGHHYQMFEMAAYSRTEVLADQPWGFIPTKSIGSGSYGNSSTGAALSLDATTLSSFSTST
ncbi:Wall-associated receptor kinase [Trema orientale]|uniref:Wall-associated receptor kinase n=1 Tax=Trema orientale TaxID=63057 RepID=A0A2P5EVV1_TREOI|nr:Wall-associated receptor kinase [Trema orientale]